MNRRGFFGVLAGALAAAHDFDPERALWVPGKKKIFIPPARTHVLISLDHASSESVTIRDTWFMGADGVYHVQTDIIHYDHGVQVPELLCVKSTHLRKLPFALFGIPCFTPDSPRPEMPVVRTHERTAQPLRPC